MLIGGEAAFLIGLHLREIGDGDQFGLCAIAHTSHRRRSGGRSSWILVLTRARMILSGAPERREDQKSVPYEWMQCRWIVDIERSGLNRRQSSGDDKE